MTEQEAWDDPEMKVILLLSGYAREIGEGKDFETTTYKTAEQIVKLFAIPNVVKSLPTDECVEQWWAEGQDQNKDFWQKAPYRTNGDIVEEIKTALKYFIETWQS